MVTDGMSGNGIPAAMSELTSFNSGASREH